MFIEKSRYIKSKIEHVVAYGHITLNTPVLVRSPKLSNVEPSQYLDGWPPGNTRCSKCFIFIFISQTEGVLTDIRNFGHMAVNDDQLNIFKRSYYSLPIFFL